MYTVIAIYGQIDGAQTEWFEELKQSFHSYVKYGGLVPFENSVEALKDYFALLFPTHFFTEGIPGTIIDTYAAGVPVISAMWESFLDIIENNVTSIGYKFENNDDLNGILFYIASMPTNVTKMRPACFTKQRNTHLKGLFSD